MEISLKLSRDFENTLNEFKNKYGHQFTTINGLDEAKLDFSSFIDNFVDNDTVNSASCTSFGR